MDLTTYQQPCSWSDVNRTASAKLWDSPDFLTVIPVAGEPPPPWVFIPNASTGRFLKSRKQWDSWEMQMKP